jgi:hypothetical protein
MNDGMPGMNMQCYTEATGHPANRNCSSGWTKQQRAPVNSAPPFWRSGRSTSTAIPLHAESQKNFAIARVPKRCSLIPSSDFPKRNDSPSFLFCTSYQFYYCIIYDVSTFPDVSCVAIIDSNAMVDSSFS